MTNGQSRRHRLGDRPAFTVIELLVTVAILSLTTFLAFSVYNPGESAKKDGVRAQLEQLGQAVVLYNLNNPSQPFKGTTENQTIAWWTALGSDFYNENLTDAWGSFYEHDPDRGLVYSYGEDTVDDLGEGDDLVYFYRPPSAYVRDRLPSPDSTVNDAQPRIEATWLFRGSTGVTTATIWIDGDIVPASIVGTSPTTIYYIPVLPLSQGAHTVRMRAEDGSGLVGRASWQFKVDVSPPSVYAMQPTSGTITGYRAFPTSAYYQDASGVRMSNTPGDAWPKLTVSGTGAPSIPNGTWEGPNEIRANIPGATVTAGSISIGAPPGGWPDGTFDFSLELQDTVGNVMLAPASWGFEVKDTSAPFINIQIPEYASKLTSSSDVDPILPGVQVNVVGATEPSAAVTMTLWHPDSSGVNRGSTSVVADAFGQFRFDNLTLWSWDGMPLPTNTLHFTADDGANPAVSVDHVVYLFDDSSNVDLVYSVATPQTTRPNEPMLFAAGATGGTTPYEFSWEFDDGYELGSVVYEPFVTHTNPGQVGSVSHTYIETGSYSVTVRVQDANGLEDSQLLSVYVGTESQNPDIELEPVPPEIAYGIPGADKTNFNITINGKFLGSWRLKVDDSPFAFRDTRWWYNGTDDWVQFTQEALDPEAANTLWQQAASNNFSVEWFGQDNTDYGDISEGGESHACAPCPPQTDGKINGNQNRGFDGNNFALIGVGDAHVATLEYRDAFGQTSKVTAPIILFNDTPQPSTIRVRSVNGDENSPALFDADFDGIWDFTNSKRVDLRIPQPPTSNNTDLWISNYPVDLHYFTDPIGINPLTTFAFDIPGNALVNRGEVFQNLTLADGEFFDATDGSSGWIPYRTDDLYRNWDLTADMVNLGFPTANNLWVQIRPGAPVPCPDPGTFPGVGPTPYIGQGKSAGDCPDNILKGDFWDANANTSAGNGLRLDQDGFKVIHAIFRSVGPFISTQGGSNDSSPHTTGVTAAEIYLDRTPPVAGPDGIELLDINVIRSPIGQDFVVARFGVQASDGAGSGLYPRGRAVIKVPAQPDILLPYADELEVTLGTFDNLASSTGNIVLTATIVFEDNLSNRSTPVSSTSSLSNIGLDLIQYKWTLIGSGDLYYFQATLEPDPSLTNAGLIDHARINAEVDDSPAGPYDTQAWFNADLNFVPAGAIDGAVQVGETNIDPENFPNPDDRLGILQAVRPPTDGTFNQTGSLSGGTVEAQQTFPVEAGNCYVLQMERDTTSGEVEYVVYERPGSGSACTAIESQAPVRSGAIVAQTDKVVNKSAQRFNFGRLLLPRDVGSGGENVELGRHVDLHRDDNGQADPTEYWDEVTDLIQSSDPLQFKTYTFRGVVGEFDSGTVGDIDYLVSIDNFRLRAFFVEDPAWDLTAATGPHGPYGVHLTDSGTAAPPGVLGATPRWVKVAPYDAPGSGLPAANFGFGPAATTNAWYDATEVYDDPEAQGGGFAGSGVGGKRFRIEFADQSQGFEAMTSGSVTAGGYIMFDPFGAPDWADTSCGLGSCELWPGFEVTGAELPDAAGGDGQIGMFSFQYLNNGYVYTNTPAQPINVTFDGGGFAQDDPFDQGQTPLIHSLPDAPVDLHMKWDHLTGKEGELKLVVRYQDEYENRIGTVVKTYVVDASPPRLDVVELRGEFYNYSKPSAPNNENWTSNPAVVLVVEGQESSAVFREFIPGDNTNTPSADITITGGNPIGCAAPDVGQSPGPGSCGIANWHNFAPGGLTATVEEYESLLLTGAASEGPVTATFRFRDAFFNHVPDFSASPPGDSVDDGPDGLSEAEPSITTWVYYDTQDPEITTITFRGIDNNGTYPDVRGGTPKRVDIGGKTWLNEQRPGVDFTFEDRSSCVPKCTSGLDVSGANGYLTVNGTNSGPGTADFPDTIARVAPGRYTGPANGTSTSRSFFIGGTGPTSQCNAAGTGNCFAGGAPMEQYGATPFVDGAVYPNNFFKFFVLDNTGRGDPTPGGSYDFLEFGFDQQGPTINAGGCLLPALELSYMPGNDFEELLVPVGGAAGTGTEGSATIEVERVVITFDNPTVGSTDAVQITGLQLWVDGAIDTTLPVGPTTLRADDPDNYVVVYGGLGGTRADEIRLLGSNLSGTPTMRVRVQTLSGRDSSFDQTDLAPPPLPANVNTDAVGADWPDIAVCVNDGAGVGVHATDEDDGDGTAQPWEVQRKTGAFGASPIDDPNWTAVQPSDAIFDYSDPADNGVSHTARMRALDRLENRGPEINLFTTTIDRTDPSQAGGFDLVGGDIAHTFGGGHPLNGVRITRVEADATFTNGTDGGAGILTHHVLRAFAPNPSTRATADLDNSLHIASVINGAAAFSLKTYRAGGQDDGLYQFAVYSEDGAGNRNETLGAGNRVDVLVDTTPPRTTGPVYLSAPSLVLRDRVGTTAAQAPCAAPPAPLGGPCDYSWTNDPNFAVNFRVQDLAFTHAYPGHRSDPGSGLDQLAFVGIDGTAGTANVAFNDISIPSPTIDGSPYTSLGIPHGFDAALRPYQEFGGGNDLSGMAAVTQGKNYIQWTPTDEASNGGSPTSTYFHYDDVGPTWTNNGGPQTTDLAVWFHDAVNAGGCAGTQYPFDLAAEGGIGADITIPATAACIRVDFSGVDVNDRALDPGFPATGIGLDYDSSKMPGGVTLYRGYITVGSGHTWRVGDLTNGTVFDFEPPSSGSPQLDLHIRDLLGNESAGEKLFGFILDTTPPIGNLVRACGDGTCTAGGQLENLSVWNTGPTPPVGEKLNLADMNNTSGEPGGCGGGCDNDDANHFWIRGDMDDLGGGFNLNASDSLEVTFANETGECSYFIDASDKDNSVWFDIISGSTGNAQEVDFYVRLPKPGTGPLAGCSTTYWDDHVGTVDNISWRIGAVIKDKGGNIDDLTRWGRIDVRAPTGFTNLDYEKNVSDWANEDLVDGGGGWIVYGDVPSTDLAANPQLRVTNAGAAVNGIVWQTTTGGVPSYQRVFSSANVGDVENDNLQIEMRATDLYGNTGTASPQAGVKLDTVDPNPDLDLRGGASLCGTSVPSDRLLDILDCGDSFPDTVEFEICEDITYDNLGMTDCTIGYDKIIGPQACAVGGGAEFTVDQPTHLADDATLLPQSWRFRVEAIDQAGNSGYNDQGSGDEIEFGIGPPPDGTIEFNENGGQGGSWINKTDHIDTGSGLEILGNQTVPGALINDVLIRITVDGSVPGWWGDAGVGPAGSQGQWVSVTTGTAIVNLSGFPAGIGSWTADIAPGVFPADICSATGIEIESVYVGCGGSALSAIDAGGQGYRLDLSVPTVSTDADITGQSGSGPVGGWYNIASANLNVGGTITDPGGAGCSGFNGSIAMSTRFTNAGGMGVQTPTGRPTGTGAQGWTHTFASGTLGGTDYDGDGDSRVEVTALEDVAGNDAAGLPVLGVPGNKLDYTPPANPTMSPNNPTAFCASPPAPGVDLNFTCSEPATSEIKFEACDAPIPADCSGWGNPPGTWDDYQTCATSPRNAPQSHFLLGASGDRFGIRARERDQAQNESTGFSAGRYTNWSLDPDGTFTTVEKAGGSGTWIDRNDTAGGLNIGGAVTGGMPATIELTVRIQGAGATLIGPTDISGWTHSITAGAWSATIPQGIIEGLTCQMGGNQIEFYVEFKTPGCTTNSAVNGPHQLDTEVPTASGVTVTNAPNGIAPWYKVGFGNMQVQANYDDNSCSGTVTADANFQNTLGANNGAATGGDGVRTINVPEGSFGTSEDNETNAIPTIDNITDAAGNVNTTNFTGTAVSIDTDDPNSPPNLTGANPAGLCGAAANVDVSYTCGGAGYQISFEECSDLLSNADCTSWAGYGGGYNACSTPLTVGSGHFGTADSRYRFRAKQQDQAGNENPTFSTPLDVDYAGDPTGTIAAIGGAWHNRNDVVTAGVAISGTIDTGAPTDVQVRVFQNDGTTPITGWTSVDTFGGGTWSHSLSDGALNNLCHDSGDEAIVRVRFAASGSCSDGFDETTMRIDSGLPNAPTNIEVQGTNNGLAGWYMAGFPDIVIEADFNDTCSGVAQVTGQLTGTGANTGPAGVGNGADVPLPPLSEGAIGAVEDNNVIPRLTNLIDNAGNPLPGPFDGSALMIDNVAPSSLTITNGDEAVGSYVNIAALGDGWDVSGGFSDGNPVDNSPQNLTICFDNSSSGPGCPGVNVSSPGTSWSHNEGYPGTGTDDDVAVTIRVNATDLAGNAATEATRAVQLDNTAPGGAGAVNIIGVDAGATSTGTNCGGGVGACNPHVEGGPQWSQGDPDTMTMDIDGGACPAAICMFNFVPAGGAPGDPSCTAGTPGAMTPPFTGTGGQSSFAKFLVCDAAENPAGQGVITLEYQVWGP